MIYSGRMKTGETFLLTRSLWTSSRNVFELRAVGESDEDYAKRPLYARENKVWKATYVGRLLGARGGSGG
jgi:hypothetical protein